MSRYLAARVSCSGWFLQVMLIGATTFFSDHQCYSQEAKLRSSRIRDLSKQIEHGNAGAIAEFWDSVKGKTPIVEKVERSTTHAAVTFLWRGDEKTISVQLVGGRPGPNGHPMLKQLSNSNIWYLTQEMHLSSRGGYAFRVNVPKSASTDLDELTASYAKSPPQSDPNNLKRSMMFSVFELPEAPPQPWLKVDPRTPKGKMSTHKLKSSHLQQTRSIVLYKPAQTTDRSEPSNLLIFFDAAYYTTAALVPTATILDNLIAAKKIGPTTAVFIRNLPAPRSRERDLAFSEPFAKFVAGELVPWVQEKHPVSQAPSKTIVCGVSLGGTAAAFCALKHSDIIGGVLAQSGSFALTPDYPIGKSLKYDTPTNWLAREFAKSEKLPLRFYLEVGLFERVASSYGADMVLEQRRLRDVLRAKRYTVFDSEYYGGHDYICHRGSLADGLIALLNQQLNPEK